MRGTRALPCSTAKELYSELWKHKRRHGKVFWFSLEQVGAQNKMDGVGYTSKLWKVIVDTYLTFIWEVCDCFKEFAWTTCSVVVCGISQSMVWCTEGGDFGMSCSNRDCDVSFLHFYHCRQCTPWPETASQGSGSSYSSGGHLHHSLWEGVSWGDQDLGGVVRLRGNAQLDFRSLDDGIVSEWDLPVGGTDTGCSCWLW